MLSGLPKWSRFRRKPAMYIFMLIRPSCRRNTRRHCSKSDKDKRADHSACSMRSRIHAVDLYDAPCVSLDASVGNHPCQCC